ncbi:hypothetical protein PAUR_b1217 [Pseudoalteromonas aurantia 208]|uniref:Uncharacterized protein n=1 Tax=Pseudoalteromonas aurantia 208 TaxID=1314867 RepID=A0ABR9EJ73_9GAMM|nr:hypothetical protein [Pseudoalteromonas aurantia 208]
MESVDIGPQYTKVHINTSIGFIQKIDNWFNQKGILMKMRSNVNKFSINKLN